MEALELVEFNPDMSWEEAEPDINELIPKASKRRRNPSSGGGIGSLIVLGGIFYLAWCGFQYYKSGIWTWTPWKTPIERFKQLPEHKVKPPSNNSMESITLIVP